MQEEKSEINLKGNNHPFFGSLKYPFIYTYIYRDTPEILSYNSMRNNRTHNANIKM